jgi:TRAP-type transport system periplasmic protein
MHFAKTSLGAALLVAVIAGAPSSAEATTVRLATFAPEGTVWDQELRSMGAQWQQGTEGRVRLRLFPGGVAGDDLDVVRKMRIGQIDAASLTVLGLAQIDPAFNVFTVPQFFHDYDELFAVIEELTPYFERRLDEKGYVLLNWGHGGWVHLFTKREVKTPEDVRGLKLYTSAGDDRMVQWWRRNGFQAVPLALTDIMTGLQTGMIEALPTTPLAALSLQWYRTTPYMLDLGLAPLVGATVVRKRTWERFSAEDRGVMEKAATQVARRLEEAVPEQDREAIEQMKERGLTVIRVAETEDEESWSRQAEEFGASMRELMVPHEVFDLALEARDRHRAAAERGEARAESR